MPEPRKGLTVTQNSEPQTWRLRAPRQPAQPRSMSYTLVHQLKDGTSRSSGPFEVTVPTILVNDPFPDALKIEFIPLFDHAAMQRVFIDVEYRDQPNAYERKERIELAGTQTDPVSLRLALLDPTKRIYRHRFTFVGNAGSLDQRPWAETSEELIGVR
jgi:hypothetical protein